MNFRALALAGALVGAMLPAALQAQTYRAEEVKKSVTLNDLKAVVNDLGHTITGEGDFGDVSLSVEDEYGLYYLLIGTACDVGGVSGCQGIMMQVRYGIDSSVTYEGMANANLAQAAINSWIDYADGTMGFTRYQVLDHGVTMANIRANVLVLLDVSPLALSVAKGQ